MSWIVAWAPQAKQALNRLPWKDAANIDAAVLRFAATGEGAVERFASDDAATIRLRVGDYRVRLTVDEMATTLCVMWLYGSHR
jgi:mRNA-degrading endonuclease RelE of RelBE toxin-antitoxin system